MSSDADLCRARGWTVGTRLVGDGTVIELTAIGRSLLLAVTISHNGTPEQHERETLWTLGHRQWQAA